MFLPRVLRNVQHLPHDGWAIVALIAWFLVYHLPVTLGQRVFSEGDILWVNLPIRAEVTRALSNGRLPLWTPLLQAGMPLFAEGRTAVLYPLNLIVHILLPPHIAISYVTLFNLSWISVGMYLFCRATGLRISSALLAGLALGTSGAITARVSHLDVLTPIAWLPWLVFFQVKYWRARSGSGQTYHWYALGCLSIGLQFLAGSPAVVALNLIVFIVLGLFAHVLWIPKTFQYNLFQAWLKFLPTSLFVTGSTVICGLGIGAAQLIPTAELLGWSLRGQELGKLFFTSYSLELSALSQFLAPFGFLGTPSAENMEFWGYFGVFPFMLVFVALILRRNFRVWFFVLFAMVALTLALGGSTPLYDWLYYVPLFNRFRAPARFLFLVLFAGAFLAATGFDELQNRLQDKPQISYRITIPIIVAVTAGAMMLGYQVPLESWMEWWQWLPMGLGLLGIAFLAMVIMRSPSRRLAQTLVIGVTCLDLVMFTAPFLSTLARTSPPSELTQVPRTVLAMDQREPLARSWVLKFPSVTQAAVRATMWSGLPMTYGRAGIIRGYMPFSLALRRNEEYIQQMSRPMRNLMNIRYYLLPLEIAPPETESPWDESQPEDGLTLELLQSRPVISPTRASRVRVVSYTDQTIDLADGFLVGEVEVTLETGEPRLFSLRLGIETADWAHEGLSQIAAVKHSRPQEMLSFPAYLRSVGHNFQGKKYIAYFDVAPPSMPALVTAIGARSFLPGAGLTIEHIDLIDDVAGKILSLSTLLKRNDLALAFRSHTAAMWENRDALPRAFIVHRAEIVNDDQALERLKTPCFLYDQLVLLSDVPTSALIQTEASRGDDQGHLGDQATVVEYKPDRVVVNVETESEGYLVLTDSWYPGWIAWVDGQETPIHRADYIFRAVRLEPGEHLIKFEYRPWSFTLGVWLSGLSCGLVIVITIVKHKRRAREK